MDGEYAPLWVHAVTPSQIVAERANDWQRFHPEDFCHLCGHRNICWWVDGELWERAKAKLPDGMTSILCPSCFVELLQEATNHEGGCWELRLAGSEREASDDV